MFAEMLRDTATFRGKRKKLADLVRRKGISDERIITAIETVPRHLFIPDYSGVEDHAYDDKAFPIGEGQTISQPFTVAYQTELLQLRGDERVLEIGTGSGYQAAILSRLVKEVYTVERIQKLSRSSRDVLADLGYKNVKVFHGDGSLGLPAFALYDRILVTAATPDIPPALHDQLAPGGIIVAPVGGKQVQQMIRLRKGVDGTFEEEYFDNFVFVPLLKGKG